MFICYVCLFSIGSSIKVNKQQILKNVYRIHNNILYRRKTMAINVIFPYFQFKKACKDLKQRNRALSHKNGDLNKSSILETRYLYSGWWGHWFIMIDPIIKTSILIALPMTTATQWVNILSCNKVLLCHFIAYFISTGNKDSDLSYSM